MTPHQQILPSGEMITVIHFVYKVDGPPISQWRIACMPNMTEFHQTPYHPSYPRTDDVRAVTCPACKRSTAFKESQTLMNEALRRPVSG